MTTTAAHILEVRRLLLRPSAALSRLSGVGFEIILQVQLDVEIGSLDPEVVRALKRALERAGVDFTSNDVRLRRPKPDTCAPPRPERTEPA